VLVVAALLALNHHFRFIDLSDSGDPGGGSAPTATRDPQTAGRGGDVDIEDARAQRLSKVMVTTEGSVSRILADDLDGSRHQRFILRLPSGHTVLVAHNIDLAPRVPLDHGDRLSLRGQYEWNERGGVLHWTHHDPDGRHPEGWIRHRGRTYE
jgi:hypothetical protein